MAERALTAEEVVVVKLIANTVGAYTVAAQVEHARVTEESRRGGIRLTIEVPSTEVTAQGAATGCLPPQGHTVSVLDDNGQPRGGVLLWLKDGLLTAVEVYDWLEEGEEVPFPRADHLRFEPSPGGR